MKQEAFERAAIQSETVRIEAEEAIGPTANLGPRKFRALAEDSYVLQFPDAHISLQIDRLRRHHDDLFGELAVRCGLPGAKSVNGILSIANFNLSSLRARQDRAKFLAGRARTKDVDWLAVVEELAQNILATERNGKPAVDLRSLPAPEPESNLTVEGLSFPRRHPTILFGDGGAAKSYLGLFLAGRLAEQGVSVGLFDWELAGEDHRDRLERLFPDGMPRIIYARCEHPLAVEVDRLARIVSEHQITFAVFDSVAFACDGPPEAAEVAGRYFRAVRRLGIGSLHVAHISKADGADKKPFGSTFWHNGARASWFAKLADTSVDGTVLTLGLFNRKNNLGRLQHPAGFRIAFDEFRTTFSRTAVADCPDLSENLTVRERILHLLRLGAMSPEEIADELDAKVDTVKRTLRRHDKVFTLLPGGRWGLLGASA